VDIESRRVLSGMARVRAPLHEARPLRWFSFDMQNWMFVAAAAIVAIPLAWVLLRSRDIVFDIEPVSRHWLEEQKRVREER
jgi:hypothetical protein